MKHVVWINDACGGDAWDDERFEVEIAKHSEIWGLLSLDSAAATRHVGFALAGFALAALASQILIVRQLSPTPRTMLRLGAAGLLTGFVALALAQNLALIVAGCTALGVGYGVIMPGLQTTASLAVGQAEQGAAAGLVSAAMALGFVVGPILGTSLYYVEPRLPFLMAVGLSIGLLAAVASDRLAPVARRIG
ncbi:MFS transporter [Methylobacterium sp. Leaf86]|uniref:MFS transporter n=1 Tax=Methylobacterium sp. Leaf86 TaxID=1736242 RepID=UPI00138F1D8B|nr:MFS transporter [Methylobacterium sp. Leaf86]